MGREKVLGVGVDHLRKKETLEILERWIGAGGGCKQVVTAYSEFFIKALEDEAFRKVINGADLVVPDGGSVLAAIRYQEFNYKLSRCSTEGRNRGSSAKPGQITNYKFKSLRRLLIGLGVGRELWGGKLGETVTGVWLFEELVRLAAEKGWKVFLLGGFGDTAEKLANKLQITNYPDVRPKVEIEDPRQSRDKLRVMLEVKM